MFTYGDVNCVHCGESHLVMFQVFTSPNSVELVSVGVEQCSKCGKYFTPTVDIVFGSRNIHEKDCCKVTKANISEIDRYSSALSRG